MPDRPTGQEPLALITGVGGFVGRHLVDELERDTAWKIVGLSRRGAGGPTGERAWVLSCDLREGELVRRVIERFRPDYVFHLAAQSYVPKAYANPGDTISNNIQSQVNLLEAVRQCELDPIILIVGSAEEYGLARKDEMPMNEDQPFRPSNPYAVSKIAQDMLGYQYHRSYGMRVIRVRPFNHFGPGQDERFVIGNFARQVAEAERGLIEPTILTGDLSVQRDFLDVRDVVRAYRLAVTRAQPGEVYNLASGVPRRIEEMLGQLVSMATVPLEVRRDPARMRPSDNPVLYGDASKFRAATGWAPARDIDESLADTLAYWREQLARG